MESGREAKKAALDLLIAGAFMASLVLVAGLSLDLDRPDGWLTAPGLFPLALSIMAFLLFARIAANAIRCGALEALVRRPATSWIRDGHRRSRIIDAIAVVGIYCLLLLAFLPFEIATFTFLVVAKRWFAPQSSWLHALGFGLAVSVTVTLIFTGVFSVRLPGTLNMLSSVLP